jgi:hypothetical protein
MGYEPELGQALFGQPHKAHAVPEIWDAALCFLRAGLDRVMWNRKQREYASPFGNTANRFECPAFTAEAYSWGNDEQPFNFKWGSVEISWYKYLGRGMSANVDLTPDMAAKMLDECLAAVRGLDEVSGDAA